jgi:hypothetical protein
LNLETLGNLGEFISGVVVIISLIYLALQVRHNTRSIRAENYGRALERVSAMQSRLSQDGDFCALFNRALSDPFKLSPDERIQFTWWLYELFGGQEFLFHQSQAGAIPEEVWKRWSDTMAWWLKFPGVRAWWVSRPTPFSASFTSYIDDLLERASADAIDNQRWWDFISANRPTQSRDQTDRESEPPASDTRSESGSL